MANNLNQAKYTADRETLHKNRPLSPHLSIYKLQLTSGLSILHRLTGAYLYLGLIILAWTMFTLVYFPETLKSISDYINSCIILKIAFKAIALSWIFSLIYHQLNGIRHLFWDMGKGFELRIAYITGKIVIIASILLTALCFYFASQMPSDKSDSEEATIIEIK
jgi:succinate dehydrogenase / fumarate reductase cytochrome b subunit